MVATVASVQSNLISSDEYFRRIGLILKSLNQVDNIKLIIKLHPRETPYEKSIKKYEESLNSFDFPKNNYQIYSGGIPREEFYSLINKSDLFINFGSTACIEALILKTPVINIDLFGNKKITGWIDDQGITVNVNYDSNLKDAAEKAMREYSNMNTKINNLIGSKYGAIDGKAYERVVQVIESLS